MGEMKMNWQNQERVTTDLISIPPAQLLSATLDRSESFNAGDALPNGWHWCYHLEGAKRSALGYDGHAAKGEFLPPIDLPRRMWAGSRFEFGAPLRFGEKITRRSNIKHVEEKTGKSGKLAFVTVAHQFFGEENDLRFIEEHDIVYRDVDANRDPDKPVVAPTSPTNAEKSVTVTPDPVLLFRYSALTFNSHRIHYDLAFCREQEGYRNLIVHGPLIATLLMNFASDNAVGRKMKSFTFKAKSPLFCDAPFGLHLKKSGNETLLWATNENGGLAMEATAQF
jgi:3-methylfumaryl-CoA hydratase